MKRLIPAIAFLALSTQATILRWHFPNGLLSNLPDPGTADAAYNVDDIFNAVVTPDLETWDRNNSSCSPSPSPPKVLCIEVSTAVSPPANFIGQTTVNSGRARLSKARMESWITTERNTLGANATLEYLSRGLAAITAHEIGHAVNINYDLDGSVTANRKYYMAQPTDPVLANTWSSTEKNLIQAWLGPSSSICPCPPATNSNLASLPIPPQMLAFTYSPGAPNYTDLNAHWGFSDVNGFEARSGNAGYAPPGYYSTHIGKASGNSSGWATTPIFSTIDRDQDGLTITFNMKFNGDYTQVLAQENYISISPSFYSNGSVSYQYNFYYRPEGADDPYETEEFSIFKNGWSTGLNYQGSWNYFTPMNQWVKFRIRIHKRQQAGGSGSVEILYRTPYDIGWNTGVATVDNEHQFFNTVDFWHVSSTNPALATDVVIDELLVEKGIH